MPDNPKSADALFRSDDEGMFQLPQFGLRLPDGVVIWGDPFAFSLIRPGNDLVGEGRTAEFYLDPNEGSKYGSQYMLDALVARYTARRVAMHITDPALPQLVRRTLLVILAPVETAFAREATFGEAAPL